MGERFGLHGRPARTCEQAACALLLAFGTGCTCMQDRGNDFLLGWSTLDIGADDMLPHERAREAQGVEASDEVPEAIGPPPPDIPEGPENEPQRSASKHATSHMAT